MLVGYRSCSMAYHLILDKPALKWNFAQFYSISNKRFYSSVGDLLFIIRLSVAWFSVNRNRETATGCLTASSSGCGSWSAARSLHINNIIVFRSNLIGILEDQEEKLQSYAYRSFELDFFSMWFALKKDTIDDDGWSLEVDLYNSMTRTPPSKETQFN